MSSLLRLLGLASVAVLGTTLDADAALVLRKEVAIEVTDSGLLQERTKIRVRLESPSDLEAWSHYSVRLDSNRRLGSFEAATITANGRRRRVGRKSQDRVEHSGDATASSQYFHVVEFPGLGLDTVLEVAYEVEIEPYFPSSQMVLLGDDRISDLLVTITGGVRWRLDGPGEGLQVEDLPDGVRIRGRDLEAVDPPELAAGGAASEPVLRWSWDPDGSWQAVSDWYGRLLDGLPTGTPEVRRLAASLTSDARTPRQRLEALVEHLRRKVRYVAVEVGIGGYRPSAPREVLERKWGDCKDKGLLLIALLKEVGIEAYPALVLLDRSGRIEPAFPSPIQFNHLIVAVPETEVETDEDDPVGGGYLFIDPTQSRGTAGWLHPGVQDQDALVVTGEGGGLVRTPLRPEHENVELTADVEVSPDGDVAGRATIALRGTYGAHLLDQIESEPTQIAGEEVMAIFKGLLPGARLEDVSWGERSGRVPAVLMSTTLEVDGLVQGTAARASFRLPGLRSAPQPRLLDEVDSAIAYGARVRQAKWRLRFPRGWCLPATDQVRIANAAGGFLQTVKTDGSGALLIERHGEVSRRWFENDRLDALRELSVAEHRAFQRRIRLECGD